MNIGPAGFTTTQLAQNIGGATAASVAQRPIGNIADLLQRASGNAATGSLPAALEAQGNPAGQNAAVPDPASILAAVVNPSVNLSPSTSLQVTDFVNASQNAFPTSAPPPPPQAAPQPSTSNTNPYTVGDAGNGNSGFAPPSPGVGTSGQASSNQTARAPSSPATTGAAASTGIYNAVASASASIIRGGSVNTVA
ncbi:MAG TPA: hypothetical protein VMV79_06400 [Alphaproteobacteria bacterium]|nr:hypothetical protein [Alphaproteobacteria bacterium]